MGSNKTLSVREITDMTETEEFWNDLEIDNVQAMYIEPPDNRYQSDEDSGDETGGLIDNLSGKQLQAPAEVVFQSGRRIGNEDVEQDDEDVEQDDEDEDNLPLSHFVKNSPRSYSWVPETDLPGRNDDVFPQKDYSKYKDMSPVELFELFVTDDVIQFLVEESNKYALFVNCQDPKITSNEMRCFLAILLVSGYDPKPSKKSYWDSGDDLRNVSVYNSMRRDRFIQIMRFLHCADNTQLDPLDKMTKLRPLMKMMKERFIANYIPDQELDYDESMIEYYGRHGCKQFIRGKPIRFSYKVWCINAKSGYLVNFEVYQGSIPNSNLEHQKKFGKATAPLIQLIEDLPPEIKCLSLRFYFDNLFTSIDFLYYLKTHGYNGTGTVRKNRLPKSCPIRNVAEIKKTKRGTYDYVSTDDKAIVVARWMDNSVVTVASSVHGIFPLSTASRYSAAEKKKIGIPRPNCIAKYNEFMGGTDQMDSNINVYRIGIRGKKWWWPIFTWLIDTAVQNAWILWRAQNPNSSQLIFRREIAQVYLKMYQNLPKSAGRPSVYSQESRVPLDIRYDRIDHIVEYVPNNKRRRCAGNHESASAVKTQCHKCNVGLCISCFSDYHYRN